MRPGTILRWHALKNILKSEIKQGTAILDVGGYDGYISCNIKKLLPNLKITVVDINQPGLRVARERGLSIICASALELPINDDSIDIVLCFDLIEHIEEDGKLVKEISRVLKKGGKVILTTPMQKGITFPTLSSEKSETVNLDWGHMRKGYSLESIKGLFENNNLAVVKINKYFNFFSRFAYQFSFFCRIPLRGRGLLYRLAIRLEPYIKYGAEEHVIIGKKLEGQKQ